MLAHGEATRNMSAREYLGNVILLIVGGNDTTRNSMSGGLLFLSQNPDEFAKLRARPELVELDGAGDHPLPDAARLHAPHRARGRRVRRTIDPQGRQGRHVVHLRQPRRGGDRRARPLHHRPRPPTPASVVRLRHSPLRRQEPGRNAIEDPVGGNPRSPARASRLSASRSGCSQPSSTGSANCRCGSQPEGWRASNSSAPAIRQNRL